MLISGLALIPFGIHIFRDVLPSPLGTDGTALHQPLRSIVVVLSCLLSLAVLAAIEHVLPFRWRLAQLSTWLLFSVLGILGRSLTERVPAAVETAFGMALPVKAILVVASDSLLLVGSILGVGVALGLAFAAMMTRVNVAYPESVLSLHVMRCLRLLDRPEALETATAREDVANSIRGLSALIGDSLGRRGSPQARRHSRSVAHRLKTLAGWAETPIETTRADLIREIEFLAECLMTGQWGRARGSEPEAEKWYVLAVGKARTVALALTPLGTVFALEGYLDMGSQAGIAKALCAIYAIVGIMKAVDPGFKETLANVRDVPLLPSLTGHKNTQ